jgi:predicted metal-dependent peptidase
MKFSRIIGKIDPELIKSAQDKLTRVFLELGSRMEVETAGTMLGGDPLIFSLVVPIEHVATMNIPTAATDGRRFYWNPQWVCNISLLGNRLASYHESGHALYMHPQRRGSRIPKLWNIAVDYIVNGMAMEDLKIRLKSDVKAAEYFVKGLGNFLTLQQCIEMYKNPFAPIAGSENWIPDPEEHSCPHTPLPAPDDDRELTEDEKKELERRSQKTTFYFADPNLPEDMKRPEMIYDALLQHLPKCPECGRVGVYFKPDEPIKKCEEEHKHHTCPSCCNGFDLFDLGDTVDEHMDCGEDPEKLAKRMSDAIEAAKKMAGRVPKGLEDELGILTAPRIRWQDVIRTRLVKVRNGNARNDWTRFRSRPMFAGLMTPKRTNCVANFIALLDTSGSMSKEDRTFGVSQLQSLDERSEGWIVCSDSEIYWSQATKLRRCNAETLKSAKIVGNGGTMFASFFSDYEKKLGKADFLIVMSDGFLLDQDIAEMKDPGIPVYWLITSGSSFHAPFGFVYDLKSA